MLENDHKVHRVVTLHGRTGAKPHNEPDCLFDSASIDLGSTPN